MAETQVQHRLGTTSDHSGFTGAEGEFTYDTDKKTVVAHDGSTAGGFPMAREDNAAAGKLSAVISPAQLTANTNDWAPTGLATASIIRAETDASRNLTGLTGGTSGRRIVIANVGAQNLVIKDDDAASTAANRFQLVADITLAPNQAREFFYDATSSRWRPIA